ncbi:MAG: hypothetical protein FWF90_03980 [Promicromonosporaceae bacterium]|nr:hypothetical protein [Promicromonosporaceae bacterium]
MIDDCPHKQTSASHGLVYTARRGRVWHDEIVCDACDRDVWFEHYEHPADDPAQAQPGPRHDPHPAHSMWEGSRE